MTKIDDCFYKDWRDKKIRFIPDIRVPVIKNAPNSRVNQFEPANEPVVITLFHTENPNFANEKIRKKQKNGSHVNDFRGNSLSLPP